jgi:hypothetical protein
LEITHTVTPLPKRKINPDKGNTQDPGGLESNVEDMEFNEVNEVPAWAAMKIDESKLITEELARDGPTIF